MPQEHLEYGLLTTFNKIFTLPGIELAESHPLQNWIQSDEFSSYLVIHYVD
ncbi:hypothetical protein AAP_03150 [Ascosphaera apis ARSEF 7405]|uniref:Uncharacterized protein n=1 Tax=Ascosphaera apis ARSEF 7405 TaxID=392613 RepID=A0A167YYQ2_9EURO|nr:hypothetical protein AAP_03150 [Ascosphaera apis ARSEF 7405]